MQSEPVEAIRPILRTMLLCALWGQLAGLVFYAAVQSASGMFKGAVGALLTGALLLLLRRTSMARVGLWVIAVILVLVTDSVLRYGPNAVMLPALLLVPLFGLFTRGARASLISGGAALGVLVLAMLWPAQPLQSETIQRASTFLNYSMVLIIMVVLMGAYDRAGRRQKAQLIAADQVKSTFLATMSHELRTPLHGVLGFTEALRDEALTSRQEGLLAEIRFSGKSLLSMVDDLLLLSQLEGETISLRPLPLDVAGLVTELVRDALPELQRKGLCCQISLEPGLPQRVALDPIAMQQVLRHLLSNAVKFTETGSIHLRIHHTGETLWVEVQDSGVGISPAVQARLFQPFQQAEEGARRRFDGSGIGLALCARLVASMNGTIQVESTPGTGSTFRVSLPAPAALPRPTPTTPPSLEGLRVLLVEDNPINRRVLRLLLAPTRCHLLEAENGAEALPLAAAADLILMDFHMPVMDGLEATRQLRARGLSVPILALTADTLPETRAACLAAGMQEVLYKPLQREPLLEGIRAYSQATAESHRVAQ